MMRPRTAASNTRGDVIVIGWIAWGLSYVRQFARKAAVG